MPLSHAPHGLKFDPNTAEAKKLQTVTFKEDQNKDNNLDFTRAPKRTYEELMPQVDYKTEYQKPPELEFVAPVRKFYL